LTKSQTFKPVWPEMRPY